MRKLSVAAVYALAVSLFVYRQVKPRDLPRIFVNAAKTTTVRAKRSA